MGRAAKVQSFFESAMTDFTEQLLSDGQKIALLQIELPKFVWVTELSSYEEFKENKANSLIMLDATGSKTYYMLNNIIFLLSKRYIYKIEDDKNVKAISSTFPESFESFSGNLK